MMKKTLPGFNRLTILMALVVLVLAGCRRDDDDDITVTLPDPTTMNADIALRYHELFLDLERFTTGYRPPVSARAAAYISWIGYESIVAAMPENNSIAAYVGLDGVPTADPNLDYHWPTVLVEAYTQATEYYFPTAPAEHLYKVYELRTLYFRDFKDDVPNDVFVRSTAYGRRVADVITAWSATDPVGHEAYLRNTDPTYTPPQGPGLWQPTYPDFGAALLPRWGGARTFAADATDVIPAPLQYSTSPTSAIYREAEVAKNMVNEIKAGGLEEDFWIAQFWSDDCPILTFTPAGRWFAVANQLVERENLTLAQTVELYARMGMALNDAGVRAWGEKYRFNYLRPIDYIREVMPGEANWNSVMCPDGSGNYFTPPFPAYPSGHATFGAVAAVVLEAFFGTNSGMTDRCHEGRTEFRGDPRTFGSFRDMAEESAYSRIPLGVHFQMDADSGLDLGYRIGEKINAMPWRR